MKGTIAFYISSHGFGHMTRCLAIIDELLKRSKYDIYVACGESQNRFAREYLKEYMDRLLFHDFVTDIGLINKKDSLRVDTIALNKELHFFVNKWERITLEEHDLLKSRNVKFVISDISPIGPLIGTRLGVESMGISNFTWLEQYENLEIDTNIVECFKNAYAQLDYFITYELALPMDLQINEVFPVGLVARRIDCSQVKDIQTKYGNSIFITCGKSANLKNINVLNYEGTIFTTSGVKINSDSKVVELPSDILDSQNYIAASELIIAKAGWGTISEALIAGKKLVLIERPSAYEDTYTINLLKEQKLAVSIEEAELNQVDIDALIKKTQDGIDHQRLGSFSNDVDSVVTLIEQVIN